jgi:UDPglucose--hexose-1-phosphate uridylyltransferase
MQELRLNLITKEWVIIAHDRAKRPEDFRQMREKKYVPERLDSCPFCPGNEGRTPPEIMRLPSDGQWKVRVTPNKLAAVSLEGEKRRINEGLKHSVTGVGMHEVIIESPRHDMLTAFHEPEALADIIAVFKTRFIEAFNDPRIEHVIIFKNQGLASGTTIQHPHSQLIGIPIMPFQVRSRVEDALRYFDSTGECLMCATVRDEKNDGRRIILETSHFITFIPYAALSPFHMWIFPKRHSASFSDISEDEIKDLALNLKTTLLKIHNGLDNPDFNYVLRSESPLKCRSEHFHWYISIVPRIIHATGFELGSGMYSNLSIPEEIAEFMRHVKTEE